MTAPSLCLTNGLTLEDWNKKNAFVAPPPASCHFSKSPDCHSWEYLSTNEAVRSLELGAEPHVEDIICVLRKCRKDKNLQYAHFLHAHIHNKGLDTEQHVGNHLVPLFIDCGSLSQAERVFYKLCEPNEFSWTAIIQGYVGSGEYQRALELFDLMHEESIYPTRHTFLAVLKACSKMKWLERGREIHDEMKNEGLQSDPIVGNTLLDMYAKCGSITDAQEFFYKLPFRDIVSWNVLLIGYVENGLDEEAFLCMEQLKSDGVVPDCITFTGSLKACGNVKAINKGFNLHAEMIERGIETDSACGNSLVNMYARCGLFMEARSVLKKLPFSDVISWSVLMVGYIENNLGEEALECFEEMQQNGIFPDVVSFISSLKACAISGMTETGEVIHNRIIQEGLEGNQYIRNSLMDMYANFGCLSEAQAVFEQMSDIRDVVSWNILIESYTELGLGEHALACLHQMHSEGIVPNATTYASVLKACAILGDVSIVFSLYLEIVNKGIEKNDFVRNSLVDAFARCSSFAEARNIFDEMHPIKEVVSWNILISAYVECGLVEEVLECLESMQESNIIKDIVTCVSSLKAFGCIRATDRVLSVHMDIIYYGFDSNIFIVHGLVDAYSECAFFTEAQFILDNVPCQGLMPWNVFMMGLLNHGFGDDCLCLMEQIEMFGLSPDGVTFLCGLRACSIMGLDKKGRDIHQKMTKQGIITHPLIGSSLINMYAKCGMLEEAKFVFDDLPHHDVVSWTAFMSGYIGCGNNEQAVECLNKMQSEGINPNATTFLCCLKVCGCMRNADGVLEIHNKVTKMGFEDLGNPLVDAYGKCGLTLESEKVFNYLRDQDTVSWTALIANSVEQGQSEKAFLYLNEMQQACVLPNVSTFACSLRACAYLRAVEKGLELYAWLIKMGLEVDTFVGTSLVEMLSKCGLFVESHIALHQWQLVDTASWTKLIEGYAEYGECDKAAECLEEMQMIGIPMDVVCLNAVMSAFSEIGDYEKVRLCSVRMQEQGILPDMSSLEIILEACGDTSSFENGKQLHAQINGMKEDIERCLSVALIDMYGKCGRMLDAHQTFDAALKKDLFEWTALITGYARQGNTELVFQILEKMIEEGIEPDGATFLSILNACSHGGLVVKGQACYMAMIRENKSIATVKHHSCLVDLLSRAGQISEATSMLESIPVQPDLVTWSALLNGNQKWCTI